MKKEMSIKIRQPTYFSAFSFQEFSWARLEPKARPFSHRRKFRRKSRESRAGALSAQESYLEGRSPNKKIPVFTGIFSLSGRWESFLLRQKAGALHTESYARLLSTHALLFPSPRKIQRPDVQVFEFFRAGDGNRTHILSLEG